MPRLARIRQRILQRRLTQEAVPYSVQSPIGGLNARDGLAEMPETDAVQLDNWFPRPTWTEIRGGRSLLATHAGNAQTILPFNTLSSGKQMFACFNNNGTVTINRVDNAAGGAAGSAVVSGLTSAIWDYEQFGTGAVEVLSLVNGLDPPMLYDGTTWYPLTITSSPYALTGSGVTNVILNTLSMVVSYKSRLWYAVKNSFTVYYLPQNVFAGALTKLDLGPLFRLGGSLQMMVSVSVDNAAGLNDYMAFISTEGEVVMFQGYDPAQIATWSEAGHFMIGRPLGFGRRGWQKLGSDAAVLCIDGIVPLSKALLTDRSQTQIAITDKIRDAFAQAAQIYGANGQQTGWDFVLFAAGTKLVINVPSGGVPIAGAAVPSYQFVQSTITGAWCTFNLLADAWAAQCFEVFQDKLYEGTYGAVYQCDVANTDDAGVPIVASAVPAFSYMGDNKRQKQWTVAQLITQCNGTLNAVITFNVDFTIGSPPSVIPLSTVPSTLWGSAWGSAWGLALQVERPWFGLAAEGTAGCLGFSVSAAKGFQCKWHLSQYLYKPGTVLYG